jgi:hypothetical protein
MYNEIVQLKTLQIALTILQSQLHPTYEAKEQKLVNSRSCFVHA